VEHFVYSSVAGADKTPGVAHFASKLRVEEYLRDSGQAYSIVRPVEFMDNWKYIRQELDAGSFADPRDSGRRHQWIASRDIGFFVAEAFDHPNDWLGRTEEIAGDEMTLGELVTIFSAVLETEIKYERLTWDAFAEEAGEEIAAMVLWFDETGYAADMDELRRRYPNLTTVEQYIEGLDW
jgi:uncharacterized protein YbjT (DUF2867 family)